MHGFIDIDIDSVPGEPVGNGITVFRLYRSDDSESARRALVVDFPPGATWPGNDVHEPGPEEVFVLEGRFEGLCGPGSSHGAGAFIHCDRGTSHAPSTRTGGRLFVFYPEG